MTRTGLDVEDLLMNYPTPPHFLSRPWIRMNFATTPNGVIQIDGTSKEVSGPADKVVFHFLRSQCDAIIVGASTARIENYSPPPANPVSDKQPRLIIVSSSLQFPSSAKFLSESHPPLIITTQKSAQHHADRVARLGKSAQVEVFGDSEIDFDAMARYLKTESIDVLLSEGGPGLFASLAKQDLVDELCLTITPKLGTGEPGGIINLSREPSINMTLGSTFSLENFVFCRYLLSHHKSESATSS